LIEMGYELYTKAHNHRLVTFLKNKAGAKASWERVGANAEMTAWPGLQLQRCPYPLDVGLERFYTGDKLKYSALLHFGNDPVGENLTAWFEHYNGRQTIEAGIKEGKRVFYLHRIKVRSEPAIYLQERMVLFAANFIRWATPWLSDQAEPVAESLEVSRMGVKRQVRVGAHVSAQVVQDSQGKLLRFSEQSVFAGKVIRLRSNLDTRFFEEESCHLMPFFNESHLIAQPLRYLTDTGSSLRNGLRLSQESWQCLCRLSVSQILAAITPFACRGKERCFGIYLRCTAASATGWVVNHCHYL